MNKQLIIVSLFVCLLTLSGCDPETFMLDGDELLSNTIKTELYQYENAQPKLLDVDGKTAPVFDFDKASFIAELDESNMKEVIKDIAQQELVYWGRALNEPIGKTLILYQSDGKMLVLYGYVYEREFRATRYYGECIMFDENGAFVAYLGDIPHEYVDLLEAEYFVTDP